jgi:FKBP-type peptidyl-prolyl cis-trans isomerase FkpA
MRKIIYLFVLPIFMLGCKNQAEIDQQIIQSYISAHHLNAIAEPGGLYYVPIAAGTGNTAATASQVTVSYRGYLTNDSVFSLSAVPFTIDLTEAIPGWQEGLPLMQRGGKATLIIPSALGYGAQAQPSQGAGYVGIPANSVLIFDIDLISFQ